MEIRQATINDLEVILELFLELDTLSIQQQPEHFQRCERSIEYLCEIVNSESSDFLLLIIDEKIVGFSLIFMKEVKGLSLLIPCKYAYIQDFVITESCRNKGYGKLLMEASKEWANKHGADYLRLSVIPKNEAGVRFYIKNGLSEQMITMECKIN